MRRVIGLWIAVLSLTACDAPSPNMRGAISNRVVVDGSHFTVHRSGKHAEAIRTTPEFRRGIMARGRRAIEDGTGCRIVPGTFTGDPAMMRAEVFCEDG